MTIFRFTFPIPDYYNENIFEKHVYFEADDCPGHDAVIKSTKEMAKQAAQASEEIGFPCGGQEFYACLKSIENILDNKSLPRVFGNLIQTL